MTNSRDVMIHTAVTIRGTQMGRLIDFEEGVQRLPNGMIVPKRKEKDNEICQFAAEFTANKTPVPEMYVRQAFDEMKEACVQKMRDAGLIREGTGKVFKP